MLSPFHTIGARVYFSALYILSWIEMGGWVDGWMGGWVDGWMDGWMDGWVGHFPIRQIVCQKISFLRVLVISCAGFGCTRKLNFLSSPNVCGLITI